MEGEDHTEMSLDDIIKIKNIQAPPSTSQVSRRLSQPYSKRGRGFAKQTIPRDSDSALLSTSEMLEAAYRAGLAAAFGAFHRGGFHSRGFQRGGLSRGGMQRFGFQRMGIQRMIPDIGRQPPLLHRLPPQMPVGGTMKVPMPSREVLTDIQISVPMDWVGKPPLRDRLGWYPWQKLTPAQQVARGKLALAKMRLNRPNQQNSGIRAFHAGVLRGRQNRIQAARPLSPRALMPPPAWTPQPTGVSPLLQHNVARLPGQGAGSRGQSVRSMSSQSAKTHRRKMSQANRANRMYLNERQFEPNSSECLSSAALQERMRPKFTVGKYNINCVHEARLDARLQQQIWELQRARKVVKHERKEDFEYSASVAATQTSSTDRFSLMMGLTSPQPSNLDPVTGSTYDNAESTYNGPASIYNHLALKYIDPDSSFKAEAAKNIKPSPSFNDVASMYSDAASTYNHLGSTYDDQS